VEKVHLENQEANGKTTYACTLGR